MEDKARSILLVEDEVIIALMVQKELERRGYRVHHANNGEQAAGIVLGGKLPLDLILMDIDLGSGLDGTETARQILACREIPVVFLSSHTEPEVVEKTGGITSYGYVVKSSGITVLDASIKMALKLFEARVARETGETSFPGLDSAVEQSINGTAVTDMEGKPSVLMTVPRDITERRRTEETLHLMAERLRLANKATSDVIWDWDVIQDTQQWNEAGTAVFGWTEIVEHPVQAGWWVERVHPDDRGRVHDSFFAVVDDPDLSIWHDEYRFVKADGAYVDVLDRGFVLRDEQGKAIRMIGAMQNITERKQAETKIKKQLAEKEMLLREVHHRIKNNFNLIASLLSLQAGSTASAESRQELEKAGSRVRSMAGLYEQMLLGDTYAQVSVKKYLEKLIAALIQVFPESASVDIQLSIEDFLLESKKVVSLGIIVNELVTNVFKYAFTGRSGGSLAISLAHSKSGVSMMVQDDGIGLEAGNTPAKGATGAMSSPGTTGLGLTLVRMLAEQLDGSFTQESDHGTTSVLRFMP